MLATIANGHSSFFFGGVNKYTHNGIYFGKFER
jgi:hypothetical protein